MGTAFYQETNASNAISIIQLPHIPLQLMMLAWSLRIAPKDISEIQVPTIARLAQENS